MKPDCDISIGSFPMLGTEPEAENINQEIKDGEFAKTDTTNSRRKRAIRERRAVQSITTAEATSQCSAIFQTKASKTCMDLTKLKFDEVKTACIFDLQVGVTHLF